MYDLLLGLQWYSELTSYENSSRFKVAFSNFKRVVSGCSISLLSGRKYNTGANLLLLSLGGYSAVLPLSCPLNFAIFFFNFHSWILWSFKGPCCASVRGIFQQDLALLFCYVFISVCVTAMLSDLAKKIKAYCARCYKKHQQNEEHLFTLTRHVHNRKGKVARVIWW